MEFVIHAGNPDGSMTLTRILHKYCIKIKMDSLWPVQGPKAEVYMTGFHS